MPDDPAPALPIDHGGFVPVIPPDAGFEALFGIEILEIATDGSVARGRVRIRDELRQQTGLLHGGVIASLSETLASWGTWVGAGGAGRAVMGMSNDTSFLRPLVDGYATAVATPRHRGRTRWLWEIEVRDDAGHLCAVGAVNIAIRPAPAAGQS
ncbi:MAG: PaaI family thioesterase [Solirubrobacteraceae bacterium]